jgi:hypothetical protein
MDFRMWLVTRGKTVYQAAMRDHDCLSVEFDKIPKGDIPLWEDAMGFAKRVFDARYGEGSYDAEEQKFTFDDPGAPNELEPLEQAWSWDDEESLKRLCPRTCAQWSGNDRF